VASEAYIRAMMALPRPIDKPWTHRDGLYGWAGEALWTQWLRMAGDIEKADNIERARLKAQKEPTISIIHPTRGRPEQAARIRKLFLDNSKNAERIEHIFGMEADSEDLGLLGRFRHATSPAGNLAQTNCVSATNAAARAACGDILIYAQDDLGAPPLHWDELIVQALGGKVDRPAMVKIGDGLRDDDLLPLHVLRYRTNLAGHQKQMDRAQRDRHSAPSRLGGRTEPRNHSPQQQRG
jgi:hypothetical protein